MVQAEPRGAHQPWTQRLAGRPSWSPMRLSLALGVTAAAVFVLVELALGRLALVFSPEAVHARGDFRVALVLIAATAYLPGALAHAVAGARDTIDALAPALRCTAAELAALRARAGRFDPARLRTAGWLGAILAAGVPLLTNGTIETWYVWLLPPEAVVHRIVLPVLGWFLGRFVYAVLVESARLSELCRAHLEVDLLDLRSLAPVTRQGLRHALLAAGLLAILALVFADTELAPNLAAVLAAGLSINALVVAAVLLLPMRGLRDAVAGVRSRELEALREPLRRARDGEPGARTLADLLAWRQYVEAVPEWPIGASTLLRIALYLGIPLGSWLGGALVERLVDLWLS